MLVVLICLLVAAVIILFMHGAEHNRELDDKEQEEFLRQWKERKAERRKVDNRKD